MCAVLQDIIQPYIKEEKFMKLIVSQEFPLANAAVGKGVSENVNSGEYEMEEIPNPLIGGVLLGLF